MKQIKQFLILALFVLSFIKITAANPNAPFNLRSFDKQNPIGTNDKPYFGWYVSDTDKNEIQSAYQIIVSSSLANLKADRGDVWDSKKTSSRKQNYIYLEKTALKTATDYYWKVRSMKKSR